MDEQKNNDCNLNEKVDKICSIFKEKYICEELRKQDENKQLIQHFQGGKYGEGLEVFLKETAWNADFKRQTKVYLIRNGETGDIRAYFSIKCGMLYSPYDSDVLEGEDRDFLNMILDAMRECDEKLLTDYAASGLYSHEKYTELYFEAKRIMDFEKKSNSEDNKSYNVKRTYPAIEIENLCKNFYGENDVDEEIPLGFLVFWFFIVPIIRKISDMIGCEYVYIYAADKTKERSEVKIEEEKLHKLVSYYRSNFGFHDATDVFFVKPYYDNTCYEMIQSVDELLRNSDSIWEKFEDILDKTEDISILIP